MLIKKMLRIISRETGFSTIEIKRRRKEELARMLQRGKTLGRKFLNPK
jgi:hypothetical protein